MSRFAPALRRIARELDVPRSLRDAILLELAADLEAAYEDGLGRGVGEDEAIRRAEEAVLGSPDIARRLSRLHADSWGGWSEAIGERLSRGAGLVLLALAVLPMLLVAARVAGAELLRAPARPLAWAVAAAGAAVAALAVGEAVRLVRGRRPSGGLSALLLLSAVAPALGLLGLALGVYDAATAFSASGPADLAGAAVALVERAGRDAAVLVAGFLAGIAGALSWFVIRSRISILAAREVESLLANGPAAPPAARGDVTPLIGRRRA